MKTERRSVLKKLVASVVGIAGLGLVAQAKPSKEKQITGLITDQEVPLFSSSVVHGDLVFVAGKGAHFEGDIKAHTAHVLDEMEKELIKAGSSMEKVLKVSVFLHDLNDYQAMNEVYRGRFGKKPPVRTTVAVYGGVPGNSLVEMDCIAHL
jgi:2-iminobutanoate/2-iminopropanoate deaminase